MVSDFARAGSAARSVGSPGSSAGPTPSGSLVTATSASEEGQLELADLELVAVLEPVRVDAPAVHVGAVQRARVVEHPVPAAADQARVVARHGHVVEEHVRLRRAPDRHLLARERERLADAPATRANDERPALRGDVPDVDRLELAGLVVDDVG